MDHREMLIEASALAVCRHRDGVDDGYRPRDNAPCQICREDAGKFLDALTTGPVFEAMVERADAYFDNQPAHCAEELEFDMEALLRAALGAAN